MIFTSLESSELKELIKEAFLEVYGQKTPVESKQLEYISRKETAQRLGISLPTLNKNTKSGVIIGYRFGGKVMYKCEDIDGCLKKIKTRS